MLHPRMLGPYEYVDTLPLPDEQPFQCNICPPEVECELYADERLDTGPRVSDRKVRGDVNSLLEMAQQQHELREHKLASLHMRVHVRFSMRVFGIPQDPGPCAPCVEVISVEVDQAHRRRYNFSRFMRFVRLWAATHGYPIYVHEVQQAYLKRKLLRDGYTVMASDSNADTSIDAYDWCLDGEHPVCFCKFFP